MSQRDAGFWKGMAVTFLFGICLGIGMANLLPAENLKQHSKITALLPQAFLYGAAICRILKTGWYRERGRKRKEGSFFLGITQAAGIYLLGILTESILNPAVLQTILRIL